jgi:hypothetical protein
MVLRQSLVIISLAVEILLIKHQRSLFNLNVRTPFSFDELDADVVLLGTPLSSVPVPVERRAAAGMCRHASVAVRPAETFVHTTTYCIRRAHLKGGITLTRVQQAEQQKNKDASLRHPRAGGYFRDSEGK